MKRRDFLKIGGTLGTGSLVLDSCGKPDQKLIPLLVSEEELVPGEENWVASLCQQCPAGCGITVRVMQGESVRMIDGQATRIKTAQAKKIEGNAKHPLNLGKTCANGCPAYWREVTAASSAWGCESSSRTSSSPE